MRRLILCGEVMLKFCRDFLVAVVEIASWIFRPNGQLKPSIVAMDLDLKSEWALWSLSMIIFLTPGSIVVFYAEGGHRLYIHFFHCPDPEYQVRRLKERFEHPLIKIFEGRGTWK